MRAEAACGRCDCRVRKMSVDGESKEFVRCDR